MDDYILSHITPEDPLLHDLYRATHLQLLRPRMASGHLQGSLLRMLVKLSGARRLLEIGTYSGYATLCMAQGMPPDGFLHTFEINDEQEAFTQPWFDRSPYAAQIKMHIGDVLELLPALDLRFDFAFIDGNKRQYVDYYELVLPRLAPGGLLVADNTLWDGRVADETYRDAQTLGIRAFNDLVAHDSRVETVLLPLRDGLTLVRKHSTDGR